MPEPTETTVVEEVAEAVGPAGAGGPLGRVRAEEFGAEEEDHGGGGEQQGEERDAADGAGLRGCGGQGRPGRRVDAGRGRAVLPLRGRPLHDLHLPGPVRRVPDHQDAARPVVGQVDEVDVLDEHDAVGGSVVRCDGEVEADGHVARVPAGGAPFLDHREGGTGDDGRLAGALRCPGEEDQQPVDHGHDEPRDEQRDPLDDDADDEGGERTPDHGAGQEPADEVEGATARRRRARGDRRDRHTGIVSGPGGDR
ncbi:hypothetical protein [Streptomyces showdoensis]|uniref:hypothetical protein n=1 Tax=Streptomyces showdoensis TaxID=68268 RepID=UPI0031E994B3